ncbi:MAG TPA: 2-succinyl-5-enolpyruvyl-6-hydroxy-3-cyclohexene-1-carboxylic-acid synthase [Chryseosolibacter sp.]
MRFQAIYDIAAVCSKKGITDSILSPGSRCAPLTLAFVRHPDILTRTISDERSAGFVALGISQESKKPVAVVCTSGTAVYNLAPSVAEAFFSQTPLILITADRPAEWIAQHDGQTIYQSEIFGKHVKKFYQLPQDYDHPDSLWAINRMVNEAINLAQQEPKGPVHINAPFREPLYPEREEQISFSSSIRIIDETQPSYALPEELKEILTSEWQSYHHILIAAGQQDLAPDLVEILNGFFKRHSIPFVTDVISNFHGVEKALRYGDFFLGQATEAVKKSLTPDLLITFGQSMISKNVKLFLRKYAPKAHWHIQPAGIVTDPFKNVTNVIRTTPEQFFDHLRQLPSHESFENQRQHNFTKLWEIEERRVSRILADHVKENVLTEFKVVNEVLSLLPDYCNLHLANSMSVRYANFIGLAAEKKGIRVFSNRGTSGIDGCTSTTVGQSISSGKPTFLITGDVAFFYDRNAFWHNYSLKDLRIVLLNNHGGLIFNMIDGPASLPESGEYFVTRQALNAKKLCEEFGFEHLHLDSPKKTKNLLKDFFEFDGKVKILEVTSEVEANKHYFESLKAKIKKSYEL